MNSKIIMLSLLVIFITISSCKKDSADAPAFSAKIGDKDWSANLTLKGTFSKGVLVVYGVSITGEVFTVTVNGKVAGTYTQSIDSLSEACVAVYKSSVSESLDDIFTSTSGQVIVTNLDTVTSKASGTFSFKLYQLADSIKVTNGVFSNITFSKN